MAGAIVAKTNDAYYMVGDRKQPLNFAEYGFHEIPERDPKEQPIVKLETLGDREVKMESPQLLMDVEGEELAERLKELFMIHRNGSISERLWGLVGESSEPLDDQPDVIDARWLSQTPLEVWEIVRDSMLRC
jgi:hypothetical protein